MADVVVDFSGMEDLLKRVETIGDKQAINNLMLEGANQLAAVYLAEAKRDTPTGQRQEQNVSASSYCKIQGEEVKAKDYKRSNNGQTRTIKRIKRSKKHGTQHKIMGTSEHMKRSWGAEPAERTSRTEYKAKVFNSASYASYVDEGHRQEPGRFVPMLGKRLVASYVQGLHITEKADQKVRRVRKRVLKRLLDKYLDILRRGK